VGGRLWDRENVWEWAINCRYNSETNAWPLPVGELLYVDYSTMQKFENRAIYTICDLAKRDVNDLKLLLGV